MPRKKANPSLRRAMCDRLGRLLRIAYDDNWAQFSERLGYANNSGIEGVKRGTSFPDVQRLEQIATWPINVDGDFRPSIHWIVSGIGPAIIRIDGDEIVEGMHLDELSKRRTFTRKI